MKIEDVAILAVIASFVMFVFGFLFGCEHGIHKGYKEGFDKALPLTYATQIKNQK